MGRIRTIKPEFWRHEDLSALPEATHMLAAALLNYADDEGFFNANPALIKAECCPIREPSVSIHDSLIALAKIGFIRLGTASDGKRYGEVKNFLDHQRINRPTPSKIKDIEIVWDGSMRTHTQLTEDSPPEGKGKEQGREQGKEEEGEADFALGSEGDLLGDIPTEAEITAKEVRQAFEAFQTVAERLGLPKARALNEDRKKHIRARLKECGGLKVWVEALGKIKDSPFLTGKTPHGFLAHLDFICQPSSFNKLLEGTYSDHSKPLPKPVDPNDRNVNIAMSDELEKRLLDHGYITPNETGTKYVWTDAGIKAGKPYVVMPFNGAST